MSAPRETIVVALFALLSSVLESVAAFKTVGRRLKDIESLDADATPAFFLIEHEDPYVRAGLNLPAKREMHLLAIVYIDAVNDEAVIPSTLINRAIDAVDAALKPDNAVNRKQTLGGLVEACLIDGPVKRASGDTTGKGLAVIPVRILMP